MAGIKATLTTSAAITTGTTNKTILALTAPANTPLVVSKISISFDGNSPTASKILTQVLRTASGGSGSAARTPIKIDASDSESPQASGAEAFSTAHSGSVVFEELIHPQGGYTAPEKIKIKAGETLAINVTAPAAVNCRARFIFEE
jgi:hypothetical protein